MENITISVFKKMLGVIVFWFLIFFLIILEKVNKCITFQGFFFRKTKLSRKCLVSLWNFLFDYCCTVMWWLSSKIIQKNCRWLVFINCQRAPPSISFISHKTSNSYAKCSVWCVMCDVPGLFFCKILNLWAKGRPTIPHLGSFMPFEWYSNIDHKWQSYVHFILQGL